jgi:hypothetical protein
VAADKSGGQHPACDRQGEHDRGHGGRIQFQRDEDDDRDEQPRQREQAVDDPHQERVGGSAGEGRGRAPEKPDDEDARQRPAGDQQRRSAPHGHAGGEIASELVGAERMRDARQLECQVEVDVVGIPGREEREYGHERDHA